MKIPTADDVRKNMMMIHSYVLPSGGRYGWYSAGKIFVGIHEDDDEIIFIFDTAKEKFIYMDEQTIRGWKLFEKMVKGGEI